MRRTQTTANINTHSTVSLVHVNTHSRNMFNEMLAGWSAAWNIGKSYSEGIIKTMTSLRVISVLRHSEWTLVGNKEMVDPASV